MTPTPREQTFTTPVAGLDVFARAWNASGASPRRTIVLVHGIGVSSRYMIPLARCLAATHEVYAVDLPGFGRSAKPRHTLSTEQLADALGGWINAVGLDAPALLGNSYGCQIAVAYATRRESVASALVLNSPTVDAERRTVLDQVARLLADAPRERWPLVLLNARDYLRAGPWRTLRTLRFAIEDRIEERIPRLAAPALIVRGARDPIVSDEWVRRLAALAPAGSLVTLPGVPHAANFSAPDRFAAAVAAFLADLGA